MHDIQLRSGVPADSLCLGTLATQVFLDTYAVDGIRTDLALEARIAGNPDVVRESIEDGRSRFILAERSGHLLGFAECRDSVRPPRISLEGGVELYRLYVQRHMQRTGIGSALLSSAEDFAKSRSAPILWLTVWTGNASAKAFYSSRGYIDVGTTEYEFGGNAYENRIYKKDVHEAP